MCSVRHYIHISNLCIHLRNSLADMCRRTPSPCSSAPGADTIPNQPASPLGSAGSWGPPHQGTPEGAMNHSASGRGSSPALIINGSTPSSTLHVSVVAQKPLFLPIGLTTLPLAAEIQQISEIADFDIWPQNSMPYSCSHSHILIIVCF